MFAVGGGLNQFLRLPWTRPVAELEEVAVRLAEAWAEARGSGHGDGRRTPRVMVA